MVWEEEAACKNHYTKSRDFLKNSGIGHSAVQFCLGYYNPSE